MTDHRPAAAEPSANLPTRKRFALTGRSPSVDPRVEAARGDLADVRLADRIFAPHYAAPIARNAIARTPVLAAHGGPAASELLKGERFDVLELSHGYAWGVGAVDGAVGFVAMDALGPAVEVTHVVCAARAAEPMGTRLTAEEATAFDAAAIRPLDAPVHDFVSLATSLTGAPTVAGGRSSAGLDSAGLVSLTLSVAGIRSPRYADLQAESLGHAVSDGAPMLRGDLLFSDGAVGVVADGASAIWCGEHVVQQGPITDFGPVSVRRRLP